MVGWFVVRGIWPMLAAIHRREYASKRGYNCFQLDRGASGREERRRIQKHFATICKRYRQETRGADHFPTCCLVAADFLKRVARRPILRNGRAIREGVADAMLRYNAGPRTKRKWRDFSYTANDPKAGKQFRVKGTIVAHKNMTIKGKKVKKGTRIRVDFLDKRPGTVVIYDELIARSREFA